MNPTPSLDTLTVQRQHRRLIPAVIVQAIALALFVGPSFVWSTSSWSWLSVFAYLAVTLLALGVVTTSVGAWAQGYRQLTRDEVEQLRSAPLVHLTREPIPLNADGTLTLRTDKCRLLARAFHRGQWWRLPTRACYLFAGDPTARQSRANITARRGQYRYVLDAGHLPADSMVRENAIAIRYDYVARVLEHGPV